MTTGKYHHVFSWTSRTKTNAKTNVRWEFKFTLTMRNNVTKNQERKTTFFKILIFISVSKWQNSGKNDYETWYRNEITNSSLYCLRKKRIDTLISKRYHFRIYAQFLKLFKSLFTDMHKCLPDNIYSFLRSFFRFLFF